MGSNSYEIVKTFKYLGPLVTNQNSIQEEIKYILKAGNHVIIQYKHLPSKLLSKNLKLNIYIHNTITLPVVLYDCETWLLTLRGDCKPYPHNVKLVNF